MSCAEKELCQRANRGRIMGAGVKVASETKCISTSAPPLAVEQRSKAAVRIKSVYPHKGLQTEPDTTTAQHLSGVRISPAGGDMGTITSYMTRFCNVNFYLHCLFGKKAVLKTLFLLLSTTCSPQLPHLSTWSR